MTELQAHWDALHHGERANRHRCPDSIDTVLFLMFQLDDPEAARAEWGEHTTEQDITRRFRR